MNKTILMETYLNCAKLLESDTVPDNNLSDMLTGVMINTKLFADKLNSDRPKQKSESILKRRSSNDGVQRKKYDTRSKSGEMTSPKSSKHLTTPFAVNTSSDIAKLIPRIYITRLVTQNEIESITDGIQHETKTELPDKVETSKPPGPVQSIVRRMPAPRTSKSDEVNLETQKKAKSEIPTKENLKPPVRVRRIVRRLTIESDESDNEVNLETQTKTKSEIQEKENLKPPVRVRRIVRRLTIESDESDNEVNLETQKKTKSEIQEKENLKPPVRVRRIVRRLTIESDESDNEVNLETQKKAKSEIQEKENLKPPVRVRRIVRRLTIESDENEVNLDLETQNRAKSEMPQKVETLRPPARAQRMFWRGNSIHPLGTTESDENDSFQVNLFNRGLSDGCIIS